MTQQNRIPDRYKCQVCNTFFVVQVLARCCEMKHDGVVFERRPEQEPRPRPDKNTEET